MTEWLLITLSIVMFRTTSWNRQLIDSQVKEASAVYEQCHVKLVIGKWREVDNEPALVKYDLSKSDSIVAVAEHAQDLPRPTLFYIDHFSDGNMMDTPFSRANFSDLMTPYPIALLDTVWLPQWMLSDQYRRERENSPYSTLAHEVSHVMTRDGDHNNDPLPNLMTIYQRRTNLLTDAQCAEIRRNAFARPMSSK